MRLRMYERFSEIWEGWSKNIFFGLIQRRGIRSKALQLLIVLIGLFVIFDMVVLPFLAVILSAFLAYITQSQLWINTMLLSFLAWIVGTSAQFFVHKKFHLGSPFYSPLYFL